MFEVRTYFCQSFSVFLEQRYIRKYEAFHTLCLDYSSMRYSQGRAIVADKIFRQFLDNQSLDYIQMDPAVVRACREKFVAAMEGGDLPPTLFDELRLYVNHKLEDTLADYYTSREFYAACRKHNGFLWRVIKLSRVTYDLCLLLLTKVTGPLLEMGGKGDLKCVPHFPEHSRARFLLMCQRFDQELMRLKTAIHTIGYLSKEVCMREKIREGSGKPALPPGHIRRNS